MNKTYYELTQEQKRLAAGNFLSLMHSRNHTDANKFYEMLDPEIKEYMKKDSSCNWEIDNLSSIKQINYEI